MFRTRGEGRKPHVARRMGRSPVEIPPALIPGFFELLVFARGSRKFLAGFAHEEIAAPPLKHPPKKSRQLRRLPTSPVSALVRLTDILPHFILSVASRLPKS